MGRRPARGTRARPVGPGKVQHLWLAAKHGLADSLDEAKAAFQAAWDAPEMKKPRGVLRNESSQPEEHTEIPMCGPVRLAETCRVSRRSSC